MLTLKSPAKINWCLRVFGRRKDGYHDLWTVMQRVTLFDELRFRKLKRDVRVYTDPELGIQEEENLVFKAALKLKEKTGFKGGVEVFLKKNIPPQAGLGGGSSNAATTLKGLNELWGLRLEPEVLREVASELGSDVPFFLTEGVCVVEGKGERVRSIGKSMRQRCLLLVKPDYGISTKEAYDRLDMYSSPVENPERIFEIIVSGSDEELSGVMVNDLEGASFQIAPELGEIKERLLKMGALKALLSGSGSTLFGLFSTEEEAMRASEEFKNYWTEVVKTL